MTRLIKDPLLERYLAGALEGETKSRVEKALESSATDRARLDELKADSAAYLFQHPPAPFVDKWEKRQKPRWKWAVAIFAPLLATAAVLLIVREPLEHEYTPKGDLVLAVHRKVGEASVRVEADQLLAPGDAIRFEVRAPGPGFVAVLGLDAQGKVTVYHPFEGVRAGPYAPVTPLLETAIELDDTPGGESLLALWSPAPFDVDWAVEALSSGTSVEKVRPRGVEMVRVEFKKKAVQ